MRLRQKIAGLGLVAGLGLLGTSVLGLGLITLARSASHPDPVRSAQGSCRVTRVTDGNTVKINCGHGDHQARLMGYSTPTTLDPKCAAEKAAGEEETRRMSTLVASGPVTGMRIVGRDSSGNDLVWLSIGGKDVSATMLKTSYALPDGGKGNPDWCGIIANQQPSSTAPGSATAFGPAKASGSATEFKPPPSSGWTDVFKPATAPDSATAFKPAPAFKAAPAFAAGS